MDNVRQPSNTFARFLRRVFAIFGCYQTRTFCYEEEYEEQSLTLLSINAKQETEEEDKAISNDTNVLSGIEPIIMNDYIDVHKFDHIFKRAVKQAYDSNAAEQDHSEDDDVTQKENIERYLVMDRKEIRDIISNRNLPTTPSMMTTQQRLDSFHDNKWQLRGIHCATNMAAAGFFCVGENGTNLVLVITDLI